MDQIDPFLCTHLIYAYANLDATSLTIKASDKLLDIDQQGYLKLIALKDRNPDLKVMVSIGGLKDSTDGSSKYSRLVSNGGNINRFVVSARTFLETYGFDGLDLDWEYPLAPADMTGYSHLMRALKDAFDPHGYLLSAAIPANVDNIRIGNKHNLLLSFNHFEYDVIEGYDLVVMSKSMDFISLMAYNFHGTSDANHPAPLFNRSWETDEAATRNVDYVVKYLIHNGLQSNKILLGISLFGRTWNLKSSAATIPPAPAAGSAPGGPFTNQPGVLAYSEICSNILNSRWTVIQDPDGRMGPYAYSAGSKVQWVGYDDPAFVQVKSHYALSMKLGGVMIWNIVGDDYRNYCNEGKNPVMKAISQVLRSSSSADHSDKTVISGARKSQQFPWALVLVSIYCFILLFSTP